MLSSVMFSLAKLREKSYLWELMRWEERTDHSERQERRMGEGGRGERGGDEGE